LELTSPARNWHGFGSKTRRNANAKGLAMPISEHDRNALSQTNVTSGEVAVGSVWSIIYLIIVVTAVTSQTIGHGIELAAYF
jgi:hypothetical protein